MLLVDIVTQIQIMVLVHANRAAVVNTLQADQLHVPIVFLVDILVQQPRRVPIVFLVDIKIKTTNPVVNLVQMENTTINKDR